MLKYWVVAECLPLYRATTKVTVVFRTTTSFWHDRWLPGDPLAKRFAALFSHCTRPQASEATVASLSLDLQPRLSAVADVELRLVLQHLHATHLREGTDLRCMASSAAPDFSYREAYRLLSLVHPRDVSACRSWALRLPTKLRIFAYLADIDRLSTRPNMFYKSCAPSDVCVACPQVETRRHLFFDCYLAREIWRCVLVRIPPGSFSIWELPSPLSIPTPVWHASVAAVLWGLWKARNDLVFNANPATSTIVLRRVCDDLALSRYEIWNGLQMLFGVSDGIQDITRSSGMVRRIRFIYRKSLSKFGNDLVHLWKALECSRTFQKKSPWKVESRMDSTNPSRPTKGKGGVHGGLHHHGRPYRKEGEESHFP
ncbi:hypothetical protein QYE76_060488 [Lolium multiflorum]|uniref:Reverse transcriptase zinc-binding domain-containing protein n=1 Tax=Lolium multiflorum TaxID=4521 RepID=A0AAD8S0I9_LOLMU|nr:hypothetical protein QYE76_060488 [Lolium multiflorum]